MVRLEPSDVVNTWLQPGAGSTDAASRFNGFRGSRFG